MTLTLTEQSETDWDETREAITYVRKFLIESDTASDTIVTALTVANLPRVGDVHPNDGRLRAINRKARRAVGNAPKVWAVDVFYSTAGPWDSWTNPDNPLLWPATWSYSYESSDINIRRDINNVPIANVNGEPYVNAAKRISDFTVTITKNVSRFSVEDTLPYMDCVNSDEFRLPDGTLVAVGLARMNNIKVEHVFDHGFEYDKVTYEIQIRRAIGDYNSDGVTDSPWDMLEVNRGTFYYEGGVKTEATKKTFTTTEGTALEFGNLKANGDKLAEGGTPIYNVFKIYDRIAFSTLRW